MKLQAWLVLAAAVLVRALAMPHEGHHADLDVFTSWLRLAVDQGVTRIAENTWCDYPPVFLYALDAAGWAWKLAGGAWPPGDTAAIRCLLKLPALLADLATALIVGRMAAAWVSPRLALAAMAAYALNPAMIFEGAVWGQIDSMIALPVVLAIHLIGGGRPGLGLAAAMVACLVKVQAVLFLLPLLVATALLSGAPGLRAGFVGMSVSATVLLLPFLLSHRLDSVAAAVTTAVGRYPWLSLNAHNVWWLYGRGNAWTTSDAIRLGNGIVTPHGLGNLMLAVVTALVTWRLVRALRRPALAHPVGALAEACALQCMAFYLFPTQMHERYIVPALAPLLVACLFRPRLAWLYGAVSLGVLVSLASTLEATYPGVLRRLGGVFPEGRGDTVALSVLFLGSFAVLLLWTADRGFRRAVPAVVAAAGLVLGCAVWLPLGGPARLCEWTPVEVREGRGNLRHDRDAGGARLDISGFVFRHGLGARAPSAVRYHLGGTFRALEAGVGLDMASPPGHRATVRVLVDQNVRFEATLANDGTPPHHLEVPLTGATWLTLEVTAPPGEAPLANWADPILLR